MHKNIKKVQIHTMKKLTSSIINYMEYLKKDCALHLSVHFDNNTLGSFPQDILEKFIPYNSHTNPYCLAVKRTSHHKCVLSQQEILQNRSGSFLRVCHAGVYEYIHTFSLGSKTGFIAVSGYRAQTRPDRVTDNYLWKKSLSSRPIPEDLLSAVIPPLVLMLKQLLEVCTDNPQSEYNLILQFLNEYHTNITLDDLCRHFGRSKSHISHIFKKSSGMSIRAYCNLLKLRDAEKLLVETNRSVTDIALDTGFNDTSYFVHIFSEKYGITPLQYRKASVS